jgi:membrane protein implicated in regulation of membrane protease activity
MIWGAVKRTTIAELIAWLLVAAALIVASLVLPGQTVLPPGTLELAYAVVAIAVYRRLYPRRRSRTRV